MHKWILTAIAVAAVSLAAACGGGDDNKTIDVGDGNEVTIGGDLPDNFPDDFPVYDGADVQGSYAGEQEGIEGIVVTWTTGDDLDDVVDFYDGAFADGPWTSTADGTAGGSSFWTVENSAGGKVGYVAVSGGDEVTIIATVGDDTSGAGSDDGSDDGGDPTPEDGDDSGADSGSSDLPDEVDLSDDFPSDRVPLPDDIRITSSSSVNAGGAQSHIVTFYSQDSADQLASFFKDGLEGNGFTQSVETTQDGGVYAAYAENEDGTGAIVIVTIIDSDVEGYREVGLQITDS